MRGGPRPRLLEEGSFRKVGSGYCRGVQDRDEPNEHPWNTETVCVALEECKKLCLEKDKCAGLAWSPEPLEYNSCNAQSKPRCNLYMGEQDVIATSHRWQEYDCYAPVPISDAPLGAPHEEAAHHTEATPHEETRSWLEALSADSDEKNFEMLFLVLICCVLALIALAILCYLLCRNCSMCKPKKARNRAANLAFVTEARAKDDRGDLPKPEVAEDEDRPLVDQGGAEYGQEQATVADRVVQAPGILGACPNGHQLSDFGLIKDGWKCDGLPSSSGCKAGTTDFYQCDHLKRFRCEQCNYDVCEVCRNSTLQGATGQTEGRYQESFPPPEVANQGGADANDDNGQQAGHETQVTVNVTVDHP